MNIVDNNYVGIKCKIHNMELYTNFCCKKNCLVALCPECIDEHNKIHKSKNWDLEIDTIKRVKTKCHEKIDFIILELQNLLSRLETSELISFDQILDKSLKDMNNFKEKIFQEINKHFINIEKEIKSKLDINKTNYKNNPELPNKLKDIIEELTFWNHSLNDNNKCIDSINKAIKINKNKIIDKYYNEIEIYLNNKEEILTGLEFNESKFNEFNVILKSLIKFDYKLCKIKKENLVKSSISDNKTKNYKIIENYFNNKFN